MHPEDVAQLFERVELGDPGVIRYQPVQVAMIDGRVLLEAHADVYGRAPDATAYVRAFATQNGFVNDVDWPAAAGVLRQQRGRVVDVTKDE